MFPTILLSKIMQMAALAFQYSIHNAKSKPIFQDFIFSLFFPQFFNSDNIFKLFFINFTDNIF